MAKVFVVFGKKTLNSELTLGKVPRTLGCQIMVKLLAICFITGSIVILLLMLQNLDQCYC